MLNIPLIVAAEPKFTPPAILTLLNPTVPVIAPVPEKVNVPAPVPEAREPEVLDIVPPIPTVIVFELPTVKAPEVNVKVPLNEELFESVTPAILLIVKLAAPVNPVPVTCAVLPLNVKLAPVL